MLPEATADILEYGYGMVRMGAVHTGIEGSAGRIGPPINSTQEVVARGDQVAALAADAPALSFDSRKTHCPEGKRDQQREQRSGASTRVATAGARRRRGWEGRLTLE